MARSAAIRRYGLTSAGLASSRAPIHLAAVTHSWVLNYMSRVDTQVLGATATMLRSLPFQNQRAESGKVVTSHSRKILAAMRNVGALLVKDMNVEGRLNLTGLLVPSSLDSGPRPGR